MASKVSLWSYYFLVCGFFIDTAAEVLPVCESGSNTIQSCCLCSTYYLCNESCPTDYLTVRTPATCESPTSTTRVTMSTTFLEINTTSLIQEMNATTETNELNRTTSTREVKKTTSLSKLNEASPTNEMNTTTPTNEMNTTTPTNEMNITFGNTTVTIQTTSMFSSVTKEENNTIVCMRSCPEYHFYNNETQECTPCDERCLNCEWPDWTKCTKCRFEYNGTCYAKCPDETIESANQSNKGTTYCEPNLRGNTYKDSDTLPVAAIAGGVTAGAVCIIAIIIVGIVLFRRRNTVQMNKQGSSNLPTTKIDTNQKTPKRAEIKNVKQTPKADSVPAQPAASRSLENYELVNRDDFLLARRAQHKSEN